jgi:hypothetical protein
VGNTTLVFTFSRRNDVASQYFFTLLCWCQIFEIFGAEKAILKVSPKPQKLNKIKFWGFSTDDGHKLKFGYFKIFNCFYSLSFSFGCLKFKRINNLNILLLEIYFS